MGQVTGIEWTDATWNPVVGCTKISAGCKYCYAKQLHDQRHKANGEGKRVPAQYAHPFEVVQLMPDRLSDPLSWKKPRRVFVNSVSDLFHDDVPDEFLDRVFTVMALSGRHTFQVLTKRAERMAEYVNRLSKSIAPLEKAARDLGWTFKLTNPLDGRELSLLPWPIQSAWLGVSVENQEQADKRIPHLLNTPAAVRFLSCEPLLGPVDLLPWLDPTGACCGAEPEFTCRGCPARTNFVHDRDDIGTPSCGIDWLICGGESGPHARPCRVEWVRSIFKQCKAAGVACFVKQMGSNIITRNDMIEDAFNDGECGWPDPDVEHNIHGFREEYQGADCRIRLRDRKGGDPTEWPEDLRIREFPV